MMNAAKEHGKQKFSISLEEKNGRILAICKQLNIVTDAEDRDQVIKDIVSLVNAHMDYAYKHGLDPISRKPRRASRERISESTASAGHGAVPCMMTFGDFVTKLKDWNIHCTDGKVGESVYLKSLGRHPICCRQKKK